MNNFETFSKLKREQRQPESSFISAMHYESLGMSTLIARGSVSRRQKQAANNYMVIKRIFGFSAVHSRITNTEMSALKRYNFSPLESSNIKQINQELEMLQKWSHSNDEILRRHADEIFEIRIKELKFLHASGWVSPHYSEIYDGHRALEKYVEFIAD